MYHFLQKEGKKAELFIAPGLVPSFCSSVIRQRAKQIWFISPGGVKPLKGSCYIAPTDGQARSLEKEKIKGSWGVAAFLLIFLMHVPFSYKVKRFFCVHVSPDQIILVTNSQFPTLWFIYSEINEPFAQHFSAFLSLLSQVHSH